MDSFLRRATPLVLLSLALIVWFEKSLPLGIVGEFLGDSGLLRFVVGLLCLYTLMLVIERQRMEQRFTQVLASFKDFYQQHASPQDEVDTAKSLEAVGILVAALDSAEPEVRKSAHANLKRLTGKDFGHDRQAWQKWLQTAKSELEAGGGEGKP